MIRLRAMSADEAGAIERLAKSRTTEARVVERARIVALARTGKDAPTIAEELGVSEKMARQWLRRFNAKGLAGCCGAPPVGAIGATAPVVEVDSAAGRKLGPAPVQAVRTTSIPRSRPGPIMKFKVRAFGIIVRPPTPVGRFRLAICRTCHRGELFPFRNDPPSDQGTLSRIPKNEARWSVVDFRILTAGTAVEPDRVATSAATEASTHDSQ